MRTSTADINIGIVGFGYWGANLARNFDQLPGFNLYMMIDPDPKRLDLARQRYRNAIPVASLEEALSDPMLDAVAISTPVETHFPLAMAALKAGKHVWLEKPMTETAEQARQLIEEAERNNVTLLVDHTFIYTGAVRKMREVAAQGSLGKILYYDSVRVNLGLFQRDVNVISDLAVHDFAILEYLLGETPIAVTASGMTHFPDVPENLAYITLFYKSGAIAHVNVNWLAPVKVRLILLGGSEKMIVYDDMTPSEKIKIYDSGVTFTDDAREIYQRRIGYRVGDMCAPKLDTSEALGVAGAHFLDCIRTGAKALTDGNLGMRVVEVIEAATMSMHRRGETVQIEFKEEAYDTVC